MGLGVGPGSDNGKSNWRVIARNSRGNLATGITLERGRFSCQETFRGLGR